MTIAELSCEVEARGTGKTYAGGMTEGDIEEIKAEAAALREMRAKARGIETPSC